MMRKLEEIRNDIKDREELLQSAKENYADVLIEYMDMGYDSTHHVPEEYLKDVVDIRVELNELYDEHRAAMHLMGW